MQLQLYVKKKWSMHPSKYKFISLELAMIRYNQYIDSVYQANESEREHRTISKPSLFFTKTFKQWLRTEI